MSESFTADGVLSVIGPANVPGLALGDDNLSELVTAHFDDPFWSEANARLHVRVTVERLDTA